MSSKKTKAKISQSDLRKMMQQMKSKKESTKPPQKIGLNNGSTLKRKVDTQFYQDKLEQKRLKANVTDKKLPEKNAFIQTYHKQVDSKTNPKSLVKESNNKSLSKTEGNKNGQQNASKKLEKVQPVLALKSSKSTPLVSGFYSDSESSEDDNAPSTSATSQSKNLFKTEEKDAKSKKSNIQSSLPAGFFDDPETDAKIRGVETPADKMDREWESFQRELQRETGQSEQLIDEEQETGHFDREIDEIDEQIQYYEKIDKLCDRKDKVVHKSKQPKSPIKKEVEVKIEVDSSSSGDEDDMLDWREKDAFT